MKIKEWIDPKEQSARIGRHVWSVSRLLELSKDLPIQEAPIDFICVWHKYEDLTLRAFVMHMKAVEAADLACPILLDEDGEVLDGRHRLIKAMLHGHKTILVRRFDENPSPDWVEDK